VDNVNQIITMTYPNGMMLTYARDKRSRMTNINLNDSSLAAQQTIM
jgi:YD repeat-containing protein